MKFPDWDGRSPEEYIREFESLNHLKHASEKPGSWKPAVQADAGSDEKPVKVER